ncbi:MAG TPA: metallophosphoesterase [Gemmataceae bacterium]|nr:metallophosphoesterase [Gemmataceae bacterium]
MRRLIVGLLAVGLVVTAVAFSGVKNPSVELRLVQEEKNPWNHLRLNNDPGDFQFAFVSDRTGGHRAQVFSRAVEQLNLLQPEFVVSVGDLIEGGKREPDKLQAEWKEFRGFIERLQMPFFYVPGNHDLSNAVQDQLWQEMFGRRYYHFVYRNVLFCLMNSEDPPGVGEGHFSDEQINYFKRVLEENNQVRWTIVVMHKPVWAVANVEKTNWLEMEKALADRPYTVFAGHRHVYKKYVRNGRRYYQLATTGGSSKMRGVRYGEFDHVVWVTMKKDGPILANILVEGIFPEDLKMPQTDEPAHPRRTQPVQPVRGRVLLDGKPIADAHVVFHEQKPGAVRPLRLDAYTEADGTFVLTTYDRHDGAPAGEYVVTLVWQKPDPTDPDKLGPNLLPERYAKPATSPLRFTVKEGTNDLVIEVKSR